MKFRGKMIGSDDPAALGAFYSDAFGEPGFRDGAQFGRNEGAQLIISGHSEVSGQNAVPNECLSLSRNDVRGSFKKVMALGAPAVAEPYTPDPEGDNWLATLKDPDGDFIQLSTPWRG